MKRFSTVLLAVLFALTSCGSKDNGLTTIKFWYAGATNDAGVPPADWLFVQRVRDELGIELKLTLLPFVESERDKKINNAVALHNLPDLFAVNRGTWLKLVDLGQVAAVDDMYAMMPRRTQVIYTPESIKSTTIDGHSYAFASPGSIPRNEGLLIRKDWLDRLGLPVPVTTDDFLRVMRAFTNDDPDGNGRKDTYGFGAFIELYSHQEGLGRRFEPLFGAFGAEGTWNFTDHPGLSVHNPAYYDALQYVATIVKEGLIDPNWITYKKDEFRNAWHTGRFGIMREQNAAYASEANYVKFDKNFPDGEWIIVNPPVGPAGKQSTGVYIQGYRMLAVSAKASRQGKKEAIARLLEWMSGDEGYFLLGWGQEGVNFVRDENGLPTERGIPDPSKGFSKPEMRSYRQMMNYVMYNSPIELTSRYPEYITPYSHKRMSSYDALMAMDALPYTPAIGSDTMPLPSQELRLFYENGVLEFVTGRRALNRETWAAWLAEFDELGGAQWEEEGLEFARRNGYIN